MASERGEKKERDAALRLETEAERYPDERGEILLEAADRWRKAGDVERAFALIADVVASGDEEDVQLAIAERIDLLAELGRWEEAAAEAEALRAEPGVAGLIAETFERHGRTGEALHWFNLACRDLLGGDIGALEPGAMLGRTEALGRARLRAASGLAPDELDIAAGESRDDLFGGLERAARPSREAPPRGAASFFVRADVPEAVRRGLVHLEDFTTADTDGYFRAVELDWRGTLRDTGLPTIDAVPTTVAALLEFAERTGGDPASEETRGAHLQAQVDSGTPAVRWPPDRNHPCWCGSSRKYKKCCGRP